MKKYHNFFFAASFVVYPKKIIWGFINTWSPLIVKVYFLSIQLMQSARYASELIQDRISLYLSASSVSISGVRPLKRGIPSTVDSTNWHYIYVYIRMHTLGIKYERWSCRQKTGRKVTLKGINVDSQMKLPATPYMPSYEGDCTDPDNIFFDGDNVSFVGRPFPLQEARMHLQRIKDWGIPPLDTWSHGKQWNMRVQEIRPWVCQLYHWSIENHWRSWWIVCVFEFHQDVWSRYSGGSGAPMWTFYAAGLDPKCFAKTEAAILHNEPRFHDSSDTYHKMLWTSNYKRLASLVMFTLFFAGKIYFPDLILNGENIQDYLQNHFLGAVEFLWKRICRKLPKLIKMGQSLDLNLWMNPTVDLLGTLIWVVFLITSNYVLEQPQQPSNNEIGYGVHLWSRRVPHKCDGSS